MPMDALLFWVCVQRGSEEWAPGVWVAVGPTHAPHLPLDRRWQSFPKIYVTERFLMEKIPFIT
jgi:hypothetical protein